MLAGHHVARRPAPSTHRSDAIGPDRLPRLPAAWYTLTARSMMSPFLSYSLVCFGSVFSIVDPFAALPMFLALAGAQTRGAQARTALRASLTCFLVLTTFALAGAFIFSFFSITLAAFKIAGGILLFGVGIEMMHAKQSETRSTHEEQAEAETRGADVGVIPLGLPLLSGPGAIATVMVLVGKAKSYPERMSVYGAILAVSTFTFLILRSAAMVSRALGKTGINLIGRIMGLILAASAMQFVLDGLQDAFPKLLGERTATITETILRALA